MLIRIRNFLPDPAKVIYKKEIDYLKNSIFFALIVHKFR